MQQACSAKDVFSWLWGNTSMTGGGLIMDAKRNYNETMASLTVRNIPEDILERIRALSTAEKRSLNNEILVILERGTNLEYEEKIHQRKFLSKSTQMELWEQLVGTWKDSRTASEIIEDIYSLRTAGRDVEL
jgi:plasmid stability protein